MKHPRKPLSDQVIVITGASSGIGMATALMAAGRGAKVVLAARSGNELARVREKIVASGAEAIIIVADVGRHDEVRSIAEAAIAAYGGFDTWVNVAGLTIYGHLWEVSDQDSKRLFETNFWGTVYGSLAAVEYLKEKGGVLINVGSVASDFAFPMQGMYTASKHAVRGFTDALRMELAQEGIPVAVTLVKPTAIDTPLPQHARNYMDKEPSLPPPIYRPQEVAAAILHAAVHPRRDLYVGGGGRVLTLLNQVAPAALDWLAPLITSLERRREPPRNPTGALQAPTGAGQVRGDAPGYVMRTSAYTQAMLNPVTTAALLLAGATAAAALWKGMIGRRPG